MSFLSNYFSLGHFETPTSTSYRSKSTLNTPSTISSDNQSLSMSSQITQSQNSPFSSNYNLASSINASALSSPKTKVPDSKNASIPPITRLSRDCSSFTVKSPSFNDSTEYFDVAREIKPVAPLRVDKVNNRDRPSRQRSKVLRNGDNYLFPALHSLSDVAFQASCIPLSLLCRFICGAFNISIHLPSRAALPSRSFTILIAYVILAFLAISMVYIYYQIEIFHESLQQLQDKRNNRLLSGNERCGNELESVRLALAKLFDRSSSILLSMNDMAVRYGIDVNSSFLNDSH